ncbi:nitrogen fixation protein NifR [Staphylococcus aureus]|nr:nitrogen fixation protein NifR [Staphylococcus aureus]
MSAYYNVQVGVGPNTEKFEKNSTNNASWAQTFV